MEEKQETWQRDPLAEVAKCCVQFLKEKQQEGKRNLLKSNIMLKKFKRSPGTSSYMLCRVNGSQNEAAKCQKVVRREAGNKTYM